MFSKALRRAIPAVTVAGLGAFSFASVAHCDTTTFEACASGPIINPFSPEAGLKKEKSLYWSALANDYVHQATTLKNCTDFTLRLKRNWENWSKLTFKGGDSSRFRYSFPPKIKPGVTSGQVIWSGSNMKMMNVFNLEGTDKIICIILREEHNTQMTAKFHWNHTEFSACIRGAGVYVGDKKTPIEVWNLVHGEGQKGLNQTVNEEDYSFAYNDELTNICVEHKVGDKVIRVKGGFGTPNIEWRKKTSEFWVEQVSA